MTSPTPPTRARAAWWLGALLGAAAAAAAMVSQPAALAPPADAVAVVGEQIIHRDDLDRAVAAMAADRRRGPQPEDRARALKRLVDEALLVDWAIESNLHRDDLKVRADLTTAALALLAAEAEALTPTDAELTTFYAQHAERFRQPRRLTLDHRVFRGADARALAEGFLRDPHSSPPTSPWPLLAPRQPLDRSDLQRHLGATRAQALWDGAPVPPWRVDGDAWAAVRVVHDKGGALPPLAEVRDLVHEAWRRDQGEQALRRFLAERRAAVRVWTAEPDP